VKAYRFNCIDDLTIDKQNTDDEMKYNNDAGQALNKNSKTIYNYYRTSVK
jgi:hypothetical protein